MIPRIVLPILALGLWPTSALAAGDVEQSSPLWHIVNFVLFVAVLIYFGRNPVLSFFAERRRDIEGELEGARRELAEAESRLEEGRRRLAELDGELEAVQAAVREQAEVQARRILDEARAASERLRRDAAAAIAQEGERMRASLRLEAGELAVRLAGDLLRDHVGEQDRVRLLDEFVSRVASPAADLPAPKRS